MNLQEYAKLNNWTHEEILQFEMDSAESDRKREIFMKQYDKEHKYCPKCGGLHHSTTMMGFMYFADNPSSYANHNDCVCSSCGDKHEFHDRIASSNP